MLYFKNKHGHYEKITVPVLLEKLKKAREQILTADSYTDGFLVHGKQSDNSEDNVFRMEYVERARERYMREHQKDILQMAVEMVDEDIFAIEGNRAADSA